MTAAFKLDKAVILERLGGDEEIYTMMVDMFLQDVENNCAALAAGLAAGGMPDLQREVHTVKGLLATFSDDAGAEAAQVVEHKIKLGQTANLAEEIASLQARLREVAGVLGAR